MTRDRWPFDAELKDLQDIVIVVDDRDLAERVNQLARVVEAMRDSHQVDERQRCLRCRPSGRRVLWGRRQPCTVHESFTGPRHRPRRPGGEQP